MEYKHSLPTLSELRKMRRELDNLRPKGVFSSLFNKKRFARERTLAEKDLERYERDVIIAHLENQNEFLLQILRNTGRG